MAAVAGSGHHLAVASPAAAVRPPSQAEFVEALHAVRRRTLALIDGIATEDLERVHSPLMSPLVWDLGHVAAFEDLWGSHRRSGCPLLRADLAELYDAFETPRAGRGDLPFLRHREALEYLGAVRERVLSEIDHHGVGTEHELVLRHEQQHAETMLQTIELARLEDFVPRAAPSPPARPPVGPVGDGGLELVSVPAGPCEIGAGPDGFAYDNERGRHRVELPAFCIGQTPITNATWLAFAEGGGYQRREWWSREGWAWKEQYDIHGPAGWGRDGREWRIGGWVPLVQDRPVVHVSWFEADAFVRAHGARLPTEAEWEKAATWEQTSARARSWPWGETAGGPERANLDAAAWGTESVTCRPGSASPCGCLAMLGDVWEWTASEFVAYPGFRAHPYPEYSEVFFARGHRVLRGGSWATARGAVSPTFRNWDLPERRQIFSGVRIARSGR